MGAALAGGREERAVPAPAGGGVPATALVQGPFRLVGAGGEDLTPPGPLRRALLAVLVLSPAQTRARAWLREMFWSQAAPERGAANLRQALSQLREDLAPLGTDVMGADAQRVWLAPGRIAPGPRHPFGADLLEGMDLRLPGAELFEEWLRAERLAEAGGAGAEPQRAPAAPGPLGLGLLPSVVPGQGGPEEARADHILDCIALCLGELLALRVYDFRDGLARGPAAALVEGSGPRLLAQVTMGWPGGPFGLRLRELGTNRLLWTAEAAGPGAAETDEFITRMVDRIAAECLSRPDRLPRAEALPYQALVTMFRLDPVALDRVEAALRAEAEAPGGLVAHSLLAYLGTIRRGERIGRPPWDDFLALAREVEQDPGFHPIALSAAGYAALLEPDLRELAGELLTRAVELNRHQAFCWDHLALHHFATGDIDRAAEASDRALALGAYSPLRYTYDTTAAMVAFARRDFAAALRHGNRALLRMSRFLPALRYSAAALGHLGRERDGRMMLVQLRRVEPNFEPGELRRRLVLRREGVPELLEDGLRLAGAG